MGLLDSTALFSTVLKTAMTVGIATTELAIAFLGSRELHAGSVHAPTTATITVAVLTESAVAMPDTVASTALCAHARMIALAMVSVRTSSAHAMKGGRASIVL